jgi:hypothetical protein
MKQLALLIFMIYFFSSCQQGTNFNPDFYVSDTRKYPELICQDIDYGVVSEENEFISCSSAEFMRGAWMSEQKIKDLAELLVRAKIPKDKRDEILKMFNKAIWWNKKASIEL